MVERIDGCNHVKCRCGIDFCYSCGAKYVDTKPNANNVHGTQGCQCPLFDAPPEDGAVAGAPDEPEAAPAEGRRRRRRPRRRRRRPQSPPPRPYYSPWAPPNSARPWRDGRCVSRAYCHDAHSIHDCARGGLCWFWHDEDDAAAREDVEPDEWHYFIFGEDPPTPKERRGQQIIDWRYDSDDSDYY